MTKKTKSEKWMIVGIIAIAVLMFVNFMINMQIKHLEEMNDQMRTIIALEEELVEARRPEPKELGVVFK